MTHRTVSHKCVSALKDGGVDFFVSVPCKLLAGMISLLEEDRTVCHLAATREEEGIGICAGAYLGGRFPAILMQNSGLGNSFNALASLVRLYRFPLVIVLSHRGTEAETVDAQRPMGRITRDLVDLLGIPALGCGRPQDVEEVESAARFARETSSPLAMLLTFSFFRAPA